MNTADPALPCRPFAIDFHHMAVRYTHPEQQIAFETNAHPRHSGSTVYLMGRRNSMILLNSLCTLK
ncbi:MAG TPA: hypothetical protein VHO84_04300 [Syntrophorhabdaceae bacterium]|nr:hypothetical protein [Syntrophorhabdaceae bacterium]